VGEELGEALFQRQDVGPVNRSPAQNSSCGLCCVVPHPLREHGGVEPVDGDGRVGRLLSDVVDEQIPALVVVDEDEALAALEQRQDVEFAGHAGSPSRHREPTFL
jgi:hypothetical protein